MWKHCYWHVQFLHACTVNVFGKVAFFTLGSLLDRNLTSVVKRYAKMPANSRLLGQTMAWWLERDCYHPFSRLLSISWAFMFFYTAFMDSSSFSEFCTFGSLHPCVYSPLDCFLTLLTWYVIICVSIVLHWYLHSGKFVGCAVAMAQIKCFGVGSWMLCTEAKKNVGCRIFEPRFLILCFTYVLQVLHLL